MKTVNFLVLCALCCKLNAGSGLGSLVAQTVGENNLNDALFLVRVLKDNNHPDANIGYAALFRSNFFNKNKTQLDAALAKVPVAGTNSNAEPFKNKQGTQAVDAMIEMFKSGPGAAAYKKLAPTQHQQALNMITQAFEATKSMLQ